jgi:beta-galactosidase
MNDIRRFVKLCQENGLWVTVRSGPYVCAEDEFGGFPAWLLKHKEMKIRANDPMYLNYCKGYVEQLAAQIGDLQITHGGPIVMVQVENELHVINDYLKTLKDIYVNAGFDTQLYTCDPSGPVWNQIEGMPGVLRGYNGMTSQTKLDQERRVTNPMGYPAFTPEIYTGWFNIWAGEVKRVSIPEQLKTTQWLLDQKNVSWTYYVFDGGTNFGFSASSHATDPVQTTYDYDAPVDELGRVTPKFKALRELFTRELNLNLPPIPPDPGVIEIPTFDLKPDAPLQSRLPANPVASNDVLTMEDVDQNYGFILYRKHFDAGVKGALHLNRALDYSIVMLNGKVAGEAFKGYGPASFDVAVNSANNPGPCDLDILVHNLGRTSSPFNQPNSRKGLQENPTLDGKPLQGWQIYSLPMDDPSQLPPAAPVGGAPGNSAPTGPMLYTGTFTLPQTGETYLDMRKWHMGVAWVNGHNLGRFWDVGASRSLYLPSVWEKPGQNQITILELGTPPATPQIKGVPNLVDVPFTAFKPFWTGKSAAAAALR